MDLKRNDYQRTTSWNAPYTFSGKEKDVETGYGYVKKLRFFSSLAFGNEKQVFHYAHCLRRFGARYYDSGLSIWLSVDPMSDKYPSLTPYAYCANNPVILVDPDGREWLNAADEVFGKILIEAAEIEKTVNSKWIKKYDKKIEKLRSNNADETEIQKYENYKKELETQNEFLDEGIATLNFCGSKDNNQKYTFNEIGNNETSRVWKSISGDNIIHFDFNSLNTAWHEVQHYTDFLKGRFSISFERDGTKFLLRSSQKEKAEINAYQSEYSYGGIEGCSSLEDAKNYAKSQFKK